MSVYKSRQIAAYENGCVEKQNRDRIAALVRAGMTAAEARDYLNTVRHESSWSSFG